MREPSLPRFLLAAYVLLVVYASLYPLAGWRDTGGSALAFLGAPWPRFVTTFDVGANVLGYVPYGLLCAIATHPRLRGGAAVPLALLTGAVLSLSLEAAQSFLPARIPSQVDVLANLAGSALGALAGVLIAPAFRDGGALERLRAETFARGPAADFGLTLLALWLFAQLNPATLLFGAGDLRDLLSAAPGPGHAPERFVVIEAAIAGTNLAAALLLASALARAGAPLARRVVLLAALVAAALLVRTLAYGIVMRAENVLVWLTPGALQGLAAGGLAALAALALPQAARLALAAVLLMAATVLVNLAPPNPYVAEILKVWAQGHFLNFNGLTRLVATAWPFAALGYLVFLAARRGREGALG